MYISWLSDFCLISWRLFDVSPWLCLGLMSQYDLMFDLKSGSLWPIFQGSVILPYILKAIWYMNIIIWVYESVWFNAWHQSKSGSLWPIFHVSVILPYILKTVWCISMIPWNNKSVWLDALPQNKIGSLWPVFHGSVILPYILKTIWCINIISCAFIHLFLFYFFIVYIISILLLTFDKGHGLEYFIFIAFTLKFCVKCLLAKRWHWPGVYVSTCSLALFL